MVHGPLGAGLRARVFPCWATGEVHPEYYATSGAHSLRRGVCGQSQLGDDHEQMPRSLNRAAISIRSNHPTSPGGRIGPGIQIAGEHERWIIRQALWRNPRIRFPRPWLFMSGVVAIANDVAIGRLIVL